MNEIHNSKASKFVSEMINVLKIDDIRFFLNILDSGIIDDVPYIKLFNGMMLFGKRKHFNEHYEKIFLQKEHLFTGLGLKKECFCAAYDALNFYHHENCTKLLKRTNLIKKDDVVLDVGCRSGHFAVKASQIVGNNGKIFSIDATYNAEQKMLRHVKYNNLKNVEFIRTLIGNRHNKEVIFFTGSDNETYSGIFEKTFNMGGDVIIKSEDHKKRLNMKMYTIDLFVNDYEIDKLDFISLQINGAEPMALEGAINSLKKYKPIIYATAFQYVKPLKPPKKAINELLTPIGYRCYLEDKEEIVYIHPKKRI